MNKAEWQKHHGISDEDMAMMDRILAAASKSPVRTIAGARPARITIVADARTCGRWLDDL